MKTARLLSAITLVVLLASASLSSIAGNDPGIPKYKLVNYVVQVTPVPNFPGPSSHFWIAITDGTGHIVSPAQAYHSGVSLYLFQEAGNMISGTRTAVMMQYPAIQNGWVIPSNTKQGSFFGGNYYLFTLTPVQYLPLPVGGGK
jgi:hypothetical protein